MRAELEQKGEGVGEILWVGEGGSIAALLSHFSPT